MLRSIMLNSQSELINYLIHEPVSIAVKDQFELVCPYISLEEDTYYHVITNISVKFIVGQLKVDVVKRF